jgi:MFS family permease
MDEYPSGGLARTLFASLHYRDNRVFWIGTTLSSIAQASFLVTAGWRAFEDAGASASGLVTFATMFPFLVATPIGGLLADRIDRRSIVLVTQVAQGGLAVVAGLLALAGALPLPLLVGLVLLSSIARTVELPTVSAVLPNLVPATVLLNTFSLNSLATLGSRFVGPALLAPVLDLWGAGPAFLLIAALYLPALLFVRRTPPMPRGDVAAATIVGLVREGGRFIQASPIVGLLLGLVILHCWLTMSFDSTLPLIAEDNLRGSGAIYSSLVAAVGIGAIAGSLVLAGLRGRSRRGTLFLGGGIVSGFSTALMAASDVWLIAIVAMIAAGFSQAMFMTLSTTLVQEVTPDALRGRVTGIFLMSAGGIMSFGNLGNGYLADRLGAMWVLAIPALAFVGLLLLVSATRPALRSVYREGMLPGARVVVA